MKRMNRRNMLLSAAAISVPVAVGCSKSDVSDAVEGAAEGIETESLEETAVVLRGFQIISWEIGKRVIFLPIPAVRIIGVTLVVSAGVAKIAIEFLDIELTRRKVVEELSSEELIEVESDPQIQFKLENGDTESVSLGPRQYE